MRRLLGSLSLLGALSLSLHLALATERPKVIYGKDNRLDYYQVSEDPIKRLADSTVALIRAADLSTIGSDTGIHTVPYGSKNALCSSEPFYNQGTAANCSGFLVSPDLVVTAGHCMFSQTQCDETRFVFGFQIQKENIMPTSVPTSLVFKCKELVKTTSRVKDDDFAVIRLDRPVTHTLPLPYRQIGSVAVGDSLSVIGYPYGLPVKIAGGAQVRALQAKYLTANLDTYNGNSGSPVFNAVTGNVEGILVNGEKDFQLQNGCYVSNLCPDDGCKGEDATLIERVLPFLK